MPLPTFFGTEMKPLCDLCGTRHEAYQAHVFASNAVSASNAASNKVVANASNGIVGVRKESGGADVGVAGAAGVVAEAEPADSAVQALPKQRWSREAYNRYQRDYMRKYRARVPS